MTIYSPSKGVTHWLQIKQLSNQTIWQGANIQLCHNYRFVTLWYLQFIMFVFLCNYKSASFPIVLTFFHHEIGANQGVKQSWDSKNHNRWTCFPLQVHHLLHWKERIFLKKSNANLYHYNFKF
jgi:hypothetical protein